jgi:small subunit ribosomal protein S1
VGQSYLFRVTQLRRGGEEAVLSRRALLEEERQEEAKAVRATLVEGHFTQGRVAAVTDFGAFVELGAGVRGMVHISELSHARVGRVEDAVNVGDSVRVKVLRLDESGHRISLSIRQATEDPWLLAKRSFQEGQVVPGTILRIADFGAFIELAPGIEALAPASEFPPTSQGLGELLAIGGVGQWQVRSIDESRRRISVGPPPSADGMAALAPGQELSGKVQRIEKFGVFVWLGPGRTGLMPRAYSGARPADDLARRFQVGQDVEVAVIELSPDGRRIRLARKGVEAKPREVELKAPARPPAKPAVPPRESAAEAPSSFGTTLADKLRAALARIEERG